MKSVEGSDFIRVALKNQMPEHRRLDHGLHPENTKYGTCEDGSQFCMSQEGRVVFARFKTGTAVRRHSKYSIIRSLEGAYWLVNSSGQLLMLD